MIKYTKFKKIINNTLTSEKKQQMLAFISHYLQNKGTKAEKYFIKESKKFLDIDLKSIEIDWDVPFPPKKNYKFTFIDLFAGIGGMRMAFQNLGGKCVFSSEWDISAQKTYELNFGEVPFGDITKIKEKDIPNHDILVAGFPCQAFSIAGKRGGFEDTRGTLFFDVARIIKWKKPKAFLLENVKGLRSHDKGKTLEVILNTLRDDLNYFVPEPKIMNAKDFGVPQNRERIFIVGFRRDLGIEDFSYPVPVGIKKTIRDIIEKEPVSVRYYMSTQYMDTLIRHKKRHEEKGNGFGYEIHSLDSIANSIVVGGMGRERNLIIDNRLKDFTPVTHIKGVVNREGIRRLTPRECARLQGFPDEFLIEVANVQAYKQFGNSVAIPAVQATAERIVNLVVKEKNQMLTGNRGDWSEMYTFLKLLGDKRLYAADADLGKIDDIFYPILKIFRNEVNGNFEYHTNSVIKVFREGIEDVLIDVPVEKFREKALFLLEKIKQSGGSSFSVPEIENFMTSIHCLTLKAPSSDKSDIKIMVHDLNTGLTPMLGFSIKSRLGSASTLLNAGKTTNFIYKISGNINEEQVNNINQIKSRSKIKDRLAAIKSYNCALELNGMENKMFFSNLQVIDTMLPQIASYLLLSYYNGHGDSLKDLTDEVEKINPCNYDLSLQHPFYKYKIKKMITEIALGMVPSIVWKGKVDATGGYIIVREDGEVLCYHIYNRNEFENYLLNNTKFETASSSRHDFGYIYEIKGEKFIKLNLQIRFR